MARYTAAYSSLLVRIPEIDRLQDLAKKFEADDPVNNGNTINALCRGSVVLLSSHLEGYVKELGELTLERIHNKSVDRSKLARQFFYHFSKDLVCKIKDSDQPETITKQILEIFRRDEDIWSRSKHFLDPLPNERFNQGFANPAMSKIKKYFNRFGYKDYTRDLAKHMTRDYQPAVNMVDHIVDIRNKIAHGDMGITKTPGDISDMTSMIKLFCNSTDTVFASWCTDNLCSIR